MTTDSEILDKLSPYLGGEPTDFVAKSETSHQIASIFLSTFGLILFLVIIPLYFLFFSVFDFTPSIRLIILIGTLVLSGLGVGIFIMGLKQRSSKPVYFAGTPTKLIRVYENVVEIFEWSQFTGIIKVIGDETRGTIMFLLKSGKMIANFDRNTERYVPDVIGMSNIKDPFEIEKLCRIRIKEKNANPTALTPIG